MIDEGLKSRVTQLLDEQEWEWEWVDGEYVPVEPDPYFYVMGLDPGGTTGVAMLRIDTRDDKINPELVYLHQIEDGQEGFKDWFYGSAPGPNMVVVSEKWKERNIKGADRTPQYIEGAMYWAWGDDIEWQYPEQKELIPDQWLKDNNFWTENRRHQMDALKHAFAYLRNQEHSATLDSLSGQSDEAMAEEGAGNEAQIGDEAQGADEALEQAMQEFAEALEQAAQEMQEFAEAFEDAEEGEGAREGDGTTDGNGEQGYGPGNNEDIPDNAYSDQWKMEPEGTRKRRERNGAFAGFEPEGADEGVTLLFED